MSSQSHHGHSATSRQFPAYSPVAATTAPAGTLLPGTKIQVGSHRVVVEKYLSEGGFAHVYVVRLPRPVDGTERAVLKRVAVPDKAALANMRTEVETMKKLKGHRHIVKYIDSHASQLRGGGYEVFLVMEYCAGGGLIDFMNTRLQHRLTEPEIVKIFSDVAEGVACMHYLKPPLLHRDLKVENVLISGKGSSAVYKLCDFGSSAPPRPAATSAAEGRLIEDDVQRHTTLQYRSPEMIDVYRKQPIDEKSDIWALGVFLYKMCYYTTPFEEVGQMAILNATFKYPSYPAFSSRLKLLIGSMLKENPRDRPNIYEVVREVCKMQGKEVPIKDVRYNTLLNTDLTLTTAQIYSNRSVSEARKYQELPPTPTQAPAVGAVFSPPMQETEIIPEIAPMRRGRPGKSPSSQLGSARPSPLPFRATADSPQNDPFAALDGNETRKKTAEEMSKRFPSLDQFDLLHEKGDRFEFEPTVETKPEDEDLSLRLTHALADDAFARRESPERAPKPAYQRPSQSSPVRAPRSREVSAGPAHLYQPTPQRPTMVSTGTMTSPAQTPRPSESKVSARPIYRFPPSDHEQRSSSLPWTSEEEQKASRPTKAPSPPMSGLNAEASPRLSSDRLSTQTSSARPSMEVLRRTSALEVIDPVGRSKSATGKARPMSVQPGAKYDLPRDSEGSRSSIDMSRMQYEGGAPLRAVRSEVDRESDRANISSDIEYLRAMEVEESSRKREKRSSGSHKHNKRGSLSGLSLSGGKNILAGRFGEAFRRFEAGNHDKPSSPSQEDVPRQGLVGMSESADGGISPNDDIVLEDADRDDISPEMRRELERRRLSQEEKRVANAAAEYRRQVAESGTRGGRAVGDGARSRAIQSKMQSLLAESDKPPVHKTATGYGRFTEPSSSLQAKQSEVKPTVSGQLSSSRTSGPTYTPRDTSMPAPDRRADASAPAGLPQSAMQRPVTRPAAPPKPKSLRVGPSTSRPGTGHDNASQATPVTPGEDWEANFSRRFPSLSGIEVETEIEMPKFPSLRTREV
ncbi:hypothetical protein N7535_000667 [Penicillium sp. DV-2018c]|nr:hypothetical protein N7535_000667 [Penicillium sp. DV-2018c]